MTKTKIGNVAITILNREQRDNVCYGDCELLDEIFSQSGSKASAVSPIQRHYIVLNALDRDSRFEKFLFRCQINTYHSCERLVRGFTLKNETVDSFRQGWKQAMEGDTRDISTLWDDWEES